MKFWLRGLIVWAGLPVVWAQTTQVVKTTDAVTVSADRGLVGVSDSATSVAVVSIDYLVICARHGLPPCAAAGHEDFRRAPRWQQPHHRSVRWLVARRSGYGRVPVHGRRSVRRVRCAPWLRLDFVDGWPTCAGIRARRSKSVGHGCSRGRAVLWGSVLRLAGRRGVCPYRAGCNWRRMRPTLQRWGS